jgi:hypothetical protein
MRCCIGIIICKNDWIYVKSVVRMSVSKIAMKFDNLVENGTNLEFSNVVLDEVEECNMKKLCKMLQMFDNSDEVFDRIGYLFEFHVVDVVDTVFHLMHKFQNNPYLQCQCVSLIRYVVCDEDVSVEEEFVDIFVDIIVKSIHIVKKCLVFDTCEGADEMLCGFTDNCIMILYKFDVKDKKNDICLNNLTEMVNKYITDDKIIDIYRELF